MVVRGDRGLRVSESAGCKHPKGGQDIVTRTVRFHAVEGAPSLLSKYLAA